MVALMDEATPLLHSVGDEESPDVSSVVRDSRSASRAAVCCAIFACVCLQGACTTSSSQTTFGA